MGIVGFAAAGRRFSGREKGGCKMSGKKIVFPDRFIWGVATSAGQTEGAALEDGRGLSIWDVFARIPGKIYHDQLPDTADDFYHRYREDCKILRDLGVQSFRMSLSWSRLFPEGAGKVNEKGIAFYHNVFSELKKYGIMPNVTLYHWDLPYALQEELGWLNRDTAQKFADYASFVFREFGDEVDYFATLNEPIATYVGYGLGAFAPGLRGERFGRQANHNLLLAHGLGVKAFRAEQKNNRIGIVIDIWNREPVHPGNERECAIAERENELAHLSYLNPVFKGDYSAYYKRWLEENGIRLEVGADDGKTIAQPLDFFGLNTYSRVLIGEKDGDATQKIKQLGGNFQANGQEFYPKAVYDALLMLKRDFIGDLPVFVTENGTYREDEGLDADGTCKDEHRIRYIEGYVRWMKRAIDEGIDLRGYYAWSLMDNWEWTAGYHYRFGLVHVDYETQKRTWKESAYWYRDLIRRNGLNG